MLLLDTSALVDLEAELAEGRVGAVRLFLSRRRGEDLACSTVSVGELATGRDETGVRVFLRRLRKVPVSEAVAHRAGELYRLQLRKGQRLGENDTWIAATALCCSATLVYSDGDFDRVGGLKRANLGRQ